VAGRLNGVIVDCAVYVEGKRREGHLSLDAAVSAAHEQEGFVWVGVHEPTAAEFEDVALQFSLHPLAVEDAIHAHQRPKLEQYDDTCSSCSRPRRTTKPRSWSRSARS